MKYQLPRGTHDVLPGDQAGPEFNVARWHHVEQLFLDQASQYGYREVRTPIFEDYELFARTSGETSDIVSKEMYDFTDKGDRHIALRPEGTAPALRAYIEHKLGFPGETTRLCYFVEVFRYDRPGKGRYRQHHQVGLELIGAKDSAAELEIIEFTYRFIESLGIKGLRVKVNSIGTADTRAAYGVKIMEHLSSWMSGKDESVRTQAAKNPMRLLDTKDPDLRAALQGLAPLSTSLNEESKAAFERLQSLLTEAEIPYVIDESLVRGLDYYNDTVFEIIGPSLGGEISLCGGGRYDPLMKQLGGPETPCVGVGIGMERIVAEMTSAGTAISLPCPDAFVVAMDESTRQAARQLVRELRELGFSAQSDVDNKNMKGQFKQADRSGAKYAVVIGSEEIAQNVLTVKTLMTAVQSTMTREEFIKLISAP